MTEQSLCLVPAAATPRLEVAAISSKVWQLQRGVENRDGFLGVTTFRVHTHTHTHVCSQHHNRLGLEERGEGEILAKKQEEDPDLWMPVEIPGIAVSEKPLLISQSRL